MYSQRLNIDALQPALSGSLGAALQAAKNAEQLEGVTWNTQDAVASTDYHATPSATPRAHATVADSTATDDDVTWTVTNLVTRQRAECRRELAEGRHE